MSIQQRKQRFMIWYKVNKKKFLVLATSLIYSACSYTSGGTFNKKIENKNLSESRNDQEGKPIEGGIPAPSSSANLGSGLPSDGGAAPGSEIISSPSFLDPEEEASSSAADGNQEEINGNDDAGHPINSEDVQGGQSTPGDAEKTEKEEGLPEALLDDASVCEALDERIQSLARSPGPTAFLSRISDMQRFLCRENGLSLFRGNFLDLGLPSVNLSKPPKPIAISEVGTFTKAKDSKAYIQVGGAAFQKNGQAETMIKLAAKYCQNFKNYLSLYPANLFESVSSLTSRNHDGVGNCDYDLKGNPVFTIVPSYKGRNTLAIHRSKQLGVMVNFLTKKPVSNGYFSPVTVHENVTLTITVNGIHPNGDKGVWVYSINRNVGYAPFSYVYNSIYHQVVDGLSKSIPYYARLLYTQK